VAAAASAAAAAAAGAEATAKDLEDGLAHTHLLLLWMLFANFDLAQLLLAPPLCGCPLLCAPGKATRAADNERAGRAALQKS
jgi:hypothetical protein